MICGMAIALASPAFAQDVAVPVDTGTDVEELVITGTRLRLPDYVLANPVVSLGEEQIQNSGATNLGEFLQSVPALVNSLDLAEGADTTTPDQAGLNLLDLRNLGVDRTLVLVNGRRHVASSPGTSAVDTNTIPVALIERVEVLTGGASAVYGADGVSGVVNFIMKKDFEGVDVRAQHTWTEEGGGGGNFFSATVGRNFADDRANITLNYEYDHQDRLTFRDRSYTYPGQRLILVDNPNDPGDSRQIPDNILATDARYLDTSLGGSFYTNLTSATTLAGVSFLGNGDPFIDGVYTSGFIMLGGSGSPLDLFNDDLLPGLDRNTFNATGRFDITPNLSVFGEAKYVKTETSFYAQPSYEYGLFIPEDNPLIPANVLADARTPGGLASTTPFDFGDDGVMTPQEYFGLPAPGVLLARDNFDLGTQNYDVERESSRFVVGLEGKITENIRFEVSYVHGRAEQKLKASNVRINERFLAATDIVNGPNGLTCRSNLTPSAVPVGDLFGQFGFDPSTFGTTFTPGPNSGCIPLNIFGEGNADPAAIDWINAEAESSAEIKQDVVTGFVTGDSTPWFSLPAGPVSVVLGAEYRKEQSDYRPSDLEAIAESLDYAAFTTLGRATRTIGEFDVKEAFTEISVPILRDVPFAQSLTVQGAYRWSDYSTAGETNTWNFGGRWQINDWVMLRATKARAVRAPNVNNLFRGRSQTFASFADPCSQENVGVGENPTQRRQNCITALADVGVVVDPSNYDFINNSSEAVGGFLSGNPDLMPEEADTKTWGIVLTPSIIPGLTFSLDYYDIQIDDAIQSYTAQTIVNNCYDLPQPNQFCDLVERTPTGANPGRISNFLQVPGNIAAYLTSGYDYSIRYNLDPADLGVDRDIGQFRFALIGNKLRKLTFQQSATASPTDSLGSEGAPEWQNTFDMTWLWRDLTVNYGLSWFSETRRFSRATRNSQPDYVASGMWNYPERSLHDVQVRYSFDDRVTVYGGVNNLTNEEPSWSEYDYPVSPQGRAYYVGLNAKF